MSPLPPRPIDRRPSRPSGRARRSAGRRRGLGFRPTGLDALEARALMAGGVFTPLVNTVPGGGSGTMMLQTDGNVLVQGGGVSNQWFKLSPDSTGNFVNGSWTQSTSMSVQRLYVGSNVLPDGRVFVIGGEYSSDGGFSKTGEIFNPATNSWTSIAPFPQSQYGDDPTQLLANGTILCGYISGPQTYIYNPTTNTWSAGGTKLRNDASDEEAFIKLPDQSLLSYDIFSSISTGNGTAQRYIPASNTWVDAGSVPVPLSSSAVGYELGPGMVLPDGRAFILGANGKTAFYTESTNTWTAGPSIPNGMAADDAPATILANGDVLFTADNPLFNGPAKVYEFNPTTNVYTDLSPLLPASFLNTPAYVDRLVDLPNGQILIANGGGQMYAFTPNGSTVAAAVPSITTIGQNPDGSFHMVGLGLNGINEGATYGDDVEMATNYPLVRFTSTAGVVQYGRSYNWTSLVSTGNTPVSTDFALPVGLASGTYQVQVVANGIASAPVSLTIPTNNADPAPTFVVAASATPNPVLVGTTTNLSALAADTLGESTLTYNWTVTAQPTGVVTPSISANNSNAAKAAIATFSSAGDYTFTVTATNHAGLSTSSSVTVTYLHHVPAIAVAASANPNPVTTGKITNLSVLGADAGGEATLTYTWVATTVPTGVIAPSFSINGTNASKNTVATFRGPGNYTFTVTVTDTQGFSSISNVNVLVNSVFSAIFVTPSQLTTPQNRSQSFLVSGYDQFGTLMSPQPTFTWTVATGGAGGTIVGSNTTAVYTSPASTYGIDRITVGAGGVTATIVVTVTQPPTITAQPADVSINAGQTAAFSATAAGYPAPAVQWYVSTNGGGSFAAIPGATNTILTLTNAGGSQNGNQYEAVFTNAAGTATSRAAVLSVASTQAVVSSVSTSWGSDRASATLFTAADGLRLLPAGRNTDLPWLSVNKLTVKFNAPVALAPGDVSLRGIAVANYGPVTITGSGTTYTITFGQPIVLPDRVTLTIANAGIVTYVRRLDVLPGDVDDSGTVDAVDVQDERNLFLNGGTSGGIPLIFGDINGDGFVDVNDYNIVRTKVGKKLP